MRLSNNKLKPDDETSLEKFETLNTLSLITCSQDHIMPVELEQALIQFIEVCLDYRVSATTSHFITQLIASNDSTLEGRSTLSSLSGLKAHVINTLIRQQVISRMNELAHEHERTGSSLDKKLYLE